MRTIDSEEEIKKAVSENTFASLSIDRSGDSTGEDEKGPSVPNGQASPKKQKKSGQRKKGKGKKASKKRQHQERATESASVNNLPMDCYRLLEEHRADMNASLVAEYLMAVLDLLNQTYAMRNLVQKAWTAVAYGDQISAVAGAVSQVAVVVIQRAASKLFVEFPDNDTFGQILQAMIRGDPESACWNFEAHYVKFTAAGTSHNTPMAPKDMPEFFMVRTYNDLIDFVKDFRMKLDGTPTRRMAADLRRWSPAEDLAAITKEGRFQWRRRYTIKWLFDLVNLFSSVVVQRMKVDGEDIDLTEVDWSESGPWYKFRRIFGLGRFAGLMCSLAWKKPGQPLEEKILPQHVFELQCIVDSWTISRGWVPHFIHGDHLMEPAEASPKRDSDLFFNTNGRRRDGDGDLTDGDGDSTDGDGDLTHFGDVWAYFINNSDPVSLTQNSRVSQDAIARRQFIHQVGQEIYGELMDWFGTPKYASGLEKIPPSLFTNSDSNGLWEYSPYLNGTGLLEGLDLVYSFGMAYIDSTPSFTMVAHLYNRLRREGYIQQTGLWDHMIKLFSDKIFYRDEIPVRDFASAFSTQINLRNMARSRRSNSVKDFKYCDSRQQQLDPRRVNVSFKEISPTQVLREANWDPNRLSESDIPLHSHLAQWMIRHKISKSRDSPANPDAWKESTLTKRFRAKGVDVTSGDPNAMHSRLGYLAEATMNHDYLPERDMLRSVERTAEEYIIGGRPFLGLCTVTIGYCAHSILMTLRERLEEAKDPVYLQAEAINPGVDSFLMHTLLTTKEKETLRTVAATFGDFPLDLEGHTYWGRLTCELDWLEM